MRLNGVFPDAALAPGRMRQGSSGAGVVLAAIVGTPADRRAPREGGDVRNGTVSGLRRLPRRGAEALRRSTSPPQGFLLPFSYTHRPGRSGAHGPAGSGVDFSIPQNSFVCVSLKMGSLARGHAQRCNGPAQNEGEGRACPPGPWKPTSSTLGHRCWLPSLLWLLWLLPSHIPTDQGAVPCTGRRALGWISRSRKTHLYAFC